MQYLSQLAEAEIDALQSEGITLTAEEIVRINELAKRVESPQTRMELSRGIPVEVGGAVLWPMTLAGSDWFQRIGCQIGGEKKQTYALAYSMAYGQKTELPHTVKEACDVVGRWARTLRCRHGELIEAIRQVHDQWEQLDLGEGGPKSSIGEISSMLTAMTGLAPEVWEYQCSIKYVLNMLDTITRQNSAEGKSTKHDGRIKAERALGLVVHKIRKKHREAGNV
jgi:hypothetical protein